MITSRLLPVSHLCCFQDRSGLSCCGLAAKGESTKILLGLATLGETFAFLLFNMVLMFDPSGLNNVASLMSKDKVLTKKMKKERLVNDVDNIEHNHHHEEHHHHAGEHRHHQNGDQHQNQQGHHNNAEHHHNHHDGHHHGPSHNMETDNDDDEEENEAEEVHISDGSEEEEEEEGEEEVSQPGSSPPASELERISTSELTNESRDDPNGNGGCNECPPAENGENSELTLSPGLQFFNSWKLVIIDLNFWTSVIFEIQVSPLSWRGRWRDTDWL